MSKTVVVTGANTGIGFEIVRQLFGHLPSGSSVILCSRNKERGEAACAALEKESFRPDLGILDIADQESINDFAAFMKEKYQKIDVLVNNAGFAFKSNATEPVHVQARKTIDVNYYGTMNVTNALKDLIVPNGRIVNVSSFMGKTQHFSNKALVKELRKPDLTVDELSALMERFIKEAEEGTQKESGWPSSTYSVSKNGLSALTRVWAREWPDFQVNACCPGWCRTNMAGDKATKSAAEGAETPVWLATREESETGNFYSDCKQGDW